MSARSLLAGIAMLVAPTVTTAQPFDLSGTANGFYQSPILLTDNGVDLSISTVGGPWLQKQSGFNLPTGMSHGVVGSAVNPLDVGQFRQVRFDFSAPVQTATFLFGDAGGDADNPITINWFDSSDLLLGSFVGTYDAGQSVAGSTGVLNTAGAAYFVLGSGSTINNENSVYWQLTSASFAPTVVPEPATLALLMLGLAMVPLVRRRIV